MPPGTDATGPAAPSAVGDRRGGPDGGLLPDASEPESEPAPDPAPDPAPWVPVISGRLEDLGDAEQPVPVRLRIEAIGVDAPIQGVGVDGEEMEVPSSAGVVGWYRFGPAPGERGSSVLAAHVSWGGDLGVFYRLRDLPVGAHIVVVFEDGSTRRFRAVALASYDKDGLPLGRIFERETAPGLTLITCGGAFNPSVRSFEDNVVVYAVPLTEALE